MTKYCLSFSDNLNILLNNMKVTCSGTGAVSQLLLSLFSVRAEDAPVLLGPRFLLVLTLFAQVQA
jgi:hypothetical protein